MRHGERDSAELAAIKDRMRAHTLECANTNNARSREEKARRDSIVWHRDWSASTMSDDEPYRDGALLALARIARGDEPVAAAIAKRIIHLFMEAS